MAQQEEDPSKSRTRRRRIPSEARQPYDNYNSYNNDNNNVKERPPQDDDNDNDDDDDDDDEDWLWLQQESCRRNPTWSLSSILEDDDDDDDGDNDSNDNHHPTKINQRRISFATCRRILHAEEWNLHSRQDFVERDWKQFQKIQRRQENQREQQQQQQEQLQKNEEDNRSTNTTAKIPRPFQISEHDGYWMDWWMNQHKDDAIQTCLDQHRRGVRPKQDQDSSTIATVCSPLYYENPQHVQDRRFQVRATSIYSHVRDGDLVTVRNVLTECEAAWLQALVHCLHDHVPRHPPFYEERAFATDHSEDYGLYNPQGGNHVTYLAALLQRFLPGVAHSLYQAVEAAYDFANWGHGETFAANNNNNGNNFYAGSSGLPHPKTLGIRTAEYLHHHTTGRLGQHAHRESLYTISIALSDPDHDYQGGYFQMKEGHNVYFQPPRLSAVVFFSEATHGITPITAGQRTVFVTELWPLDHVPLGLARPSVEYFEHYIQQRQGILVDEEDNEDEEEEEDNDNDEDEEEEEEDNETNNDSNENDEGE
ncbi:hypothetical protein ACA910_014390 [Epithemia clementina (nom. ined.)]